MSRGMTLADFARTVPGDVAKKTKAVLRGTRDSAAQEGLRYAQAVAPVGGVLSKDKKPGRLKKSIRLVSKKDSDFAARVVSQSPDAPHAAIIDRGRKRGVTPKGKKRVRAREGEKLRPRKDSKMLGSRQAPSGISKVVGKRLLAHMDAFVADAIRKADG